MINQSLISKILTALLRLIFQLNYEKSATRSTSLAGHMNKKRSVFHPIGYNITRYSQGKYCVEKITPAKIKSDRVIFHIHGGSFKMELTDLYRWQSVIYSRLFNNCTVYNVDYRIYPHVRFPVPLDDVYNAYLHLVNSGISPDKIIVVGDSCGSNMAATLCMRLRDNAKPLPAALILFSFWGDLSNSGSSYRDNCHRDPFYGIPKRLSFEECEDSLRRITLYAQGENLYNPYLSPCFGDFSHFPKTVLVTGSADMSQSDSITAYEKLKNADVDALLLSYENMFHDFQMLTFLPESRHAYKSIKAFI